MATQNTLSRLTTEDFTEIEDNLRLQRHRRINYVCERQRQLNHEAMQRVRECLQDYMNRYYSPQKAQEINSRRSNVVASATIGSKEQPDPSGDTHFLDLQNRVYWAVYGR